MVEPRPGNRRPHNRALAVQLSGPGKRMALIQPSDRDFGRTYSRSQPHITEFTLELDNDWIRAQANPGAGHGSHLSISAGGLAIQLLVAQDSLHAFVHWPGNLTVSLGKIPLQAETSYPVRIFCKERGEYRVEIGGDQAMARSVRVGDRVETRAFSGATANQPYSEARVYAALINPEWDCIPELRLETNTSEQHHEGRAFLDDIRFVVPPE